MSDQDEARRVLGHVRDGGFAALVLTTVQLVAETHPDLLRSALSQVFDLKALERDYRRILALQEEARKRFADDRELVSSIRKDIDRIEARIDALHFHLEQVEESR